VAMTKVSFIFSFTQGLAFFFPATTVPTQVGPCTFHSTRGVSVDGGVPERLASAGPLSFTGLEMPLTIVPTADNAYSGDVKGRTFEAGNPITMTAVGDVVPPFSTTLLAPAIVKTQSPSSLSRGASATVTWTPDATATQFRVFVLGSSGLLDCSYDGAAGTALVPAEALELFTPGDKVQLVPAPVASKTLDLPGWQVETLILQTDEHTSGTL